MKIKNPVQFQVSTSSLFPDARRRVFADFGSARLVRKPDGRHELIGDTLANHATAIE